MSRLEQSIGSTIESDEMMRKIQELSPEESHADYFDKILNDSKFPDFEELLADDESMKQDGWETDFSLEEPSYADLNRTIPEDEGAEALIERAFAGISTEPNEAQSHVAERAEPLHASDIHIDQSETPLETSETEESNETLKEANLKSLRAVAREMRQANRTRDLSDSEQTAAYQNMESRLVGLFKECEASGVSQELLEYVARDIDESATFDRESAAKHRAEVEWDTAQEPTEEAAVVAENEPVVKQVVETVIPTEEPQIEPIESPEAPESAAGWWARNRETMKKPFGIKFWADKWDTLADPYRDLSARVASQLTDVVRELQYRDEIRLSSKMSVEEIGAYKERRRRNIMLGIVGTYAISKVVGETLSILTSSGMSASIGEISGSGASETVLGTPSPDSSDILANSMPPSSGDALQANVPHNLIGNEYVGHVGGTDAAPSMDAASFVESKPNAFKIATGEGGVQWFDKLGLGSKDWYGVKDELIKRFPHEFYSAGGDVRINHTGELPKAVQQFITDRFKV